MADPMDCVAAMQQVAAKMDVQSGSIAHTLAQLETAVQQQAEGLDVKLERHITKVVRSPTGGSITVDRFPDVMARGPGEKINTEIKTGKNLHDLLDVNQLVQDAALAISEGVRTPLQNVWRTTSLEFTGSELPLLQRRMQDVVDDLQLAGFNDKQIKRAIESFHFEDAFGNAIEFTFGPDGPIAKTAFNAASHSPDFRPAMEVLFGAGGKVADAAHDAAGGTNLDPALANLEEKLEKGVGTALDKAGEASAAHAAGALGQKVSAGATALGGALTAVPQLYDSVTKLGDAWKAPLNTTQDYMNLLSAAGGAVGQAGQTLEAFAGFTKVAAAAQAIFNAVMALNPVVLVVIAVVALIAAIVLLITYWDQVKAALRDNPWLAVAASLLGIIGIIVVIIAYWDEIKLAVLIAANFVSIQAQRIGLFFVGMGTLIGQVWDRIVASVANVGIAIVNAFISAGTAVQNFFIGVINWVLEQYNKLADSALGDLAGLEHADLIPEVDVQTRLIPPREVPEINVAAAFDTGQVTGGLEGQIAAQEKVVADAQRADEERRRGAAAPAAGPPAAAAPAATPGLPPLPAGARPELPPGAGTLVPSGPADQSVRVEGGITVNINAERLEADAAQLLSEEIIRKIQEKLGALRAEQDFRTGSRAPATT